MKSLKQALISLAVISSTLGGGILASAHEVDSNLIYLEDYEEDIDSFATNWNWNATIPTQGQHFSPEFGKGQTTTIRANNIRGSGWIYFQLQRHNGTSWVNVGAEATNTIFGTPGEHASATRIGFAGPRLRWRIRFIGSGPMTANMSLTFR